MKALEWRSESEFAVDGVQFQCAVGDYTGKTTRERFMLLKDRGCLEQYATVLATDPPRNILEFGIFQGGSPALFSLWFGAKKFVGIDICDPVPAFDEFCRTHDVGRNIRTYYGVSQTDQQRIEQIVQTEFGRDPPDLIIDDASHQYSLTRRTFEIAFPLLRPGGTYVIEDWGWAHWSGYELDDHYAGRTALSMLLMELLMLCASRPDLISDIRVFPAFAFIRKAREAPPLTHFSLRSHYVKRNIEMLGPEHFDLARVARLAASRAAYLTRRRLRRTRDKLARAWRRWIPPD